MSHSHFFHSLLSPSINSRSEVPSTGLIFRAKHVERENHKTELQNGERRRVLLEQETLLLELDEARSR